MALTLHNPHSVLAALETRPKDVLQLSLKHPGDAWARAERLARESGVRVVSVGRSASSHTGAKGGGDGRDSQEEAQVREREGVSAEELFSDARERKGGRGLWLALDSLQDPHNVGAIFRAAAFFGVEGILLTQERSAPLSATVYDVASGGVEYVPFTLQTNLQRAFEIAKEAGLWILGASEHANDDLGKIERDRPWLLVLGNEEKGMRRLTAESCDLLCKVAPHGARGGVTSLNVSVAAGILMARLTSAL